MNNWNIEGTRGYRLKADFMMALSTLMLFLTSGYTATLRNSELRPSNIN